MLSGDEKKSKSIGGRYWPEMETLKIFYSKSVNWNKEPLTWIDESLKINKGRLFRKTVILCPLEGWRTKYKQTTIRYGQMKVNKIISFYNIGCHGD